MFNISILRLKPPQRSIQSIKGSRRGDRWRNSHVFIFITAITFLISCNKLCNNLIISHHFMTRLVGICFHPLRYSIRAKRIRGIRHLIYLRFKLFTASNLTISCWFWKKIPPCFAEAVMYSIPLFHSSSPVQWIQTPPFISIEKSKFKVKVIIYLLATAIHKRENEAFQWNT